MAGRRVFDGLRAGLYWALLGSTALGQMNGFPNGSSVAPHGVPASVTSFGFGGHPGFNGVPASVTSLGFGSGPLVTNPTPFLFRHHHTRFLFSPFFAGAYYVPYPYPVYIDSGIEESADENDRGGPTVFDRRGQPSRYYGGRERETEDYRAELSSREGNIPAPAEAAEQPRTLLIFKDGHQLEVSNYAIVGPTLYDLTGGRTRKIQLAELDLAATVEENDERGVQFELPQTTRPN